MSKTITTSVSKVRFLCGGGINNLKHIGDVKVSSDFLLEDRGALSHSRTEDITGI